MPLQNGQILNNRYRIVKLLGHGGFGAVYRAWDMNMESPCAVKENFDTSQEAVRQFKREASLLHKLRHPNLPLVFDTFSIPGQGQYLVMDFVDGHDLQEMLDRQGGPLPESQVLPWIEQVCDALIYLHNQSPPIIHRDIKPANIRITPDGKAMLVDFGIAKVFDPQLSTTIGARAITPGYSPPEQYGQGRTDARTDVYALGATLYSLLTGLTPPDSVDVMTGSSSPPASVTHLNPNVSQAIDAAVKQATQLDRSQRFQSADEFKISLTSRKEVISTLPVSSVSPSIGKTQPEVFYRSSIQPAKSGGRTKWLLGAAGVVIITLIAVLLWPEDGMKKVQGVQNNPVVAALPSSTSIRIYLPTETPIPTAIPSPINTLVPTREPTLTPSPSSTPTNTPTPIAIVLLDDVPLREGPWSYVLPLTYLDLGDELEVVGILDDNSWVSVTTGDGVSGWVEIENVEINLNLGELIVLNSPPTQTAIIMYTLTIKNNMGPINVSITFYSDNTKVGHVYLTKYESESVNLPSGTITYYWRFKKPAESVDDWIAEGYGSGNLNSDLQWIIYGEGDMGNFP